MSQFIVMGTKVEQPVQSRMQFIANNKQNFRFSGLPGGGCSGDGNFFAFSHHVVWVCSSSSEGCAVSLFRVTDCMLGGY
jgi:hypothetical protein